MKRQNILLLLACVLIALVPLFLVNPHDENEEIFTGADGQAEGVITEIAPEYKPWFEPFWESPSGEIESLLFGLQAALGAALIGYCIGYYRGRGKAVGASLATPGSIIDTHAKGVTSDAPTN